MIEEAQHSRLVRHSGYCVPRPGTSSSWNDPVSSETLLKIHFRWYDPNLKGERDFYYVVSIYPETSCFYMEPSDVEILKDENKIKTLKILQKL